ncbi:MAG: hypothetical protein ACRDVM_08755, partial [Acidimicrobiia bacterium]
LVVGNPTDYPVLIWPVYTGDSITVQVYSTPNVVVEETRQEVGKVGQCTVVTTFRRRTFPDRQQVDDSVFAVYRPGEGLDCDGRTTPPVEP